MIFQAVRELRPNAAFEVRNRVLVWKESSLEKPTEAQIQAKIAELEAAEPMRLLREKRNQLLAQSDWMAVADRTMSPEQIAFRQALRDMPENNPDVALNEAGELINVIWPTEPTT